MLQRYEEKMIYARGEVKKVSNLHKIAGKRQRGPCMQLQERDKDKATSLDNRRKKKACIECRRNGRRVVDGIHL